ncbi:MAG TPA: hypothetical protein VIJ25_11790, partial [Methylococcales bacterium]
SKIYALSYPQVASETGSCGNNVHMNHQEVVFSNQLIGYLDWVIQQAARRAGVNFVDLNTGLYGHRLCEPSPAINGVTSGTDGPIVKIDGPTTKEVNLKLFGSESFHPTAYGQQLIEEDILGQTNELSIRRMPAPDDSVEAPTDKDAFVLLTGAPKDGSKFAQQYFADDITSDVLVLGKSEQLTLGGSGTYLQPSSSYNIQGHSDPIDLGHGVTDENGNIATSFVIPIGTTPGFHEIHIYGTDINGDPVDIVKTVFVATSEDSATQEVTVCRNALSSEEALSDAAIADACTPKAASGVQTPVATGQAESVKHETTTSIDESAKPTASEDVLLADMPNISTRHTTSPNNPIQTLKHNRVWVVVMASLVVIGMFSAGVLVYRVNASHNHKKI